MPANEAAIDATTLLTVSRLEQDDNQGALHTKVLKDSVHADESVRRLVYSGSLKQTLHRVRGQVVSKLRLTSRGLQLLLSLDLLAPDEPRPRAVQLYSIHRWPPMETEALWAWIRMESNQMIGQRARLGDIRISNDFSLVLTPKPQHWTASEPMTEYPDLLSPVIRLLVSAGLLPKYEASQKRPIGGLMGVQLRCGESEQKGAIRVEIWPA